MTWIARETGMPLPAALFIGLVIALAIYGGIWVASIGGAALCLDPVCAERELEEVGR